MFDLIQWPDPAVSVTALQFVVLACVGVVVFRIAALFQRVGETRGYDAVAEAFERNNHAVLLRLSGFVFALLLAVGFAHHPTGYGIAADMAAFAKVSFGALVLLSFAQVANDLGILRKVHNSTAVVQGRDVGVACVECGSYIATALVFAGSMHIVSNGFWFNAGTFVVGQVFLIGIAFAFSLRFRAMHDKIQTGEKGAIASALALAGIMIAGGIDLGALLRAPVESWSSSIPNLVFAVALWLLIMEALHWALHFTLVKSKKFSAELASDGNWAAGLAYGGFAIAITLGFVAQTVKF